MSPRPVVGVAIVRDGPDGPELLAARRSAPPDLAGGWELPGGKVEAGESVEQAARREILEELGVAVIVGELVAGPDDGAWPLGSDYCMSVVLGRIGEGQEPAPLLQHDELRWLPFDRWNDVPWLAGDVAPVRAVVNAVVNHMEAP